MKRVVIHQFGGATTMEPLPLAAGLLAAAVKADPGLACTFECDIVVGRPSLEHALRPSLGAAVAGFSCYSWNTRYALEVAKRAKARDADVLIVLGGPSVPRNPKRIAAFMADNPFVDVLVLGEGERTFCDLLRSFGEGDPRDALGRMAGIPGSVVRAGRERRDASGLASSPLCDGKRANSDRLTIAPQAERLSSFDPHASPYLDGTFDALVRRHPFGVAVLETNRGCPFSCSFCDWGQATQSKVIELPAARLEAELDWIGSRGIPYLYLVDANFGIRPRDLELLSHLVEVKKRRGLPHFCFFHLTKNATRRNLEIAEVLNAAGIRSPVALSMQDFDANVLAAVRRSNIKPEKALELRAACHDKGIPTLNEILLGLPGQTFSSFKETLGRTLSPYPDDTFFIHLTRVLENAELGSDEDRARFGLRTRHCDAGATHGAPIDPFIRETEEIVVGTHSLPEADWKRAFKLAYLISACHNLGLIGLVSHALLCAMGHQVSDVYDHLLDQLETAAVGTVFAALDAVLSRFAESILAGEALVLPFPDCGDPEYRWSVDETFVMLALMHRESFFQELEVALLLALPKASPPNRATPQFVTALVRFQAFSMPALGRPAQTASFAVDGLGFAASLGGEDVAHTVLGAPKAFSYTPPDWGVEWKTFMLHYLAQAYARTPQTWVRAT